MMDDTPIIATFVGRLRGPVGTIAPIIAHTNTNLAQVPGLEHEVANLALQEAETARAAEGEFDARPAANRPEYAWQRLVTALGHAGFTVEELPHGDMQLEYVFDPATGRLVGKTQTLHDFTASTEGLARDLTRAVERAFAAPAEHLAQSLSEALTNDNYVEMSAALEDASAAASIYHGATKELLNTLLQVNAEFLTPHQRSNLYRCQLGAAHRVGRNAMVGKIAAAMLSDASLELSTSERGELRMAVGVGHAAEGRIETAVALWHSLLEDPQGVAPRTRGWLYRNLSLAHSDQHPDARRFARCSADAFLEIGDRREAGKSFVCLAKCLTWESPAAAVTALEEIKTWFEANNLSDRDDRAAILHVLANQLYAFGRPAEAYAVAQEAADLRADLLGAEEARIASLYLAGFVAERAGMTTEAIRCNALASALAKATGSVQFALAERVNKFFDEFDRATADALVRDALAAGEIEIESAARAAIATCDNTLDHASRLEILELALQRLTEHGADAAALEPVRLAIAMRLTENDEHDRAADWYEKILDDEPLHGVARQNYAATHFKRRDASARQLPRLATPQTRSEHR
jgi:hypothetical protein